MDQFLQMSISRGLALVLDQVWFKAAGVTLDKFFPAKQTQWQWMLLYALFLTLMVYFIQLILRQMMIYPNKAKQIQQKTERLSQRLMILLDEDKADTVAHGETLTPEKVQRRKEIDQIRTELNV